MNQNRKVLWIGFSLLLGLCWPTARAVGSPLTIPADEEIQVQIETNLSSFTLRMLPQFAPKTVENFLTYVTAGAYDNTIIHRSVRDFIVQAGGFSVSSGSGGFVVQPVVARGPVINEFGKSNVRGTVAMAKLGNQPNSATNQWFINMADNRANLDNQNEGFTVFAEVVGRGMREVDSINQVTTVNASSLDPAFTTLPLIGFQADAEDPIVLEQFVTIKSARAFDFLGLPPAAKGLRESFWLGRVNDAEFNRKQNVGWVWHQEHEWLYATGRGYLNGIWFWDAIQEEWLWTKHDVYPFFYAHNEGNGYWLYYKKGGTPTKREFYDYRVGQWMAVAK